jgi:hypothetical protein
VLDGFQRAFQLLLGGLDAHPKVQTVGKEAPRSRDARRDSPLMCHSPEVWTAYVQRFLSTGLLSREPGTLVRLVLKTKPVAGESLHRQRHIIMSRDEHFER